MWKPELNFITIHYLYIVVCGFSGLLFLLPYGNLSAVDSLFFGVSASTESGLNPVDVNDLETYQQVYTYIMAVITNMAFINVMVVVVRLWWFKRKLMSLGTTVKPGLVAPAPGPVLSQSQPHSPITQVGSTTKTKIGTAETGDHNPKPREDPVEDNKASNEPEDAPPEVDETKLGTTSSRGAAPTTRITFAPAAEKPPPSGSKALYIPPPRARDNGQPFVEKDVVMIHDEEEGRSLRRVRSSPEGPGLIRRRTWNLDGPTVSKAISLDRMAADMFVLGAPARNQQQQGPRRRSTSREANLPFLSKQVTVGRNSQFLNMTSADRERLGGVEYRALKVLLKIASGYFVALHILGIISLVPWIYHAPAKYQDYLAEKGIDRAWWALYSAQTMANNLGFTLTPDSMISFRDATWPMAIMTFLAFAANTCYPIFLRLIIWLTWLVSPRDSSLKDTLRFLLDHPRRCYTLLFPSRPTWILLAIVFFLNFVDVLLIITLDLDNPAVNALPLGPRILASLFQAASARHTGTATYNLSAVNPAVQFSLLVMMYIAVLPIAITIRSSNTYEERSLGIYKPNSEEAADETDGTSYLLTHIRNQFSFDLWYIFLGTFCICAAEADRIMDRESQGIDVFTIFFEATSAYGNVGLSLGHPTVNTSLSGVLSPFSKVVICAMMIRGRHRGLPYSLDRAIMLPSERMQENGEMAPLTDLSE
ncbi:potassium transporter [Immersiella caudata]|uniref:Potassium transport protein n=1 Tax=Immersiella caudata TaxID=314043 RepID=A0AA39WYT6_9PEZI|nr:potassium transporter [Immersiella caudata]